MTKLTLTRKPGQAIVIDGPAVIRVASDSRGRTKLQIEAAPEVAILREEVQHRYEKARTDK